MFRQSALLASGEIKIEWNGSMRQRNAKSSEPDTGWNEEISASWQIKSKLNSVCTSESTWKSSNSGRDLTFESEERNFGGFVLNFCTSTHNTNSLKENQLPRHYWNWWVEFLLRKGKCKAEMQPLRDWILMHPPPFGCSFIRFYSQTQSTDTNAIVKDVRLV